MTIYSLDVILSLFGTYFGSVSSSNCCFLTCIQISQEGGQLLWYSHLLKYFPWFIVIHRLKFFSIVNRAETDVFLELSCFFHDPADVGNLISGSSAFSKTSLKIWKFPILENMCIPVADSCWCMAKPIEYCKAINLQLQ